MLVIKVGGSEGIDYDAVADDVAALVKEGQPLVLIHGGSSLTNQVAEQLGHPPRFVTSPSGHTSRRTDRRTLEIFEMVYCGQMNKGVVEKLQQRGVNAIGLSGLDGRIWEGKRKPAIRIVENGRQMILRDDFTGNVERINTTLLRTLMDAGYTPVLTPPAISTDSEAINVDADRAAGLTAVALEAETLLLLSNVPGLLKDFPDESSLITHVAPNEIDRVAEYAEGRMKKKVLGAQEALDGGVARVVMGDARIAQPIRTALAGQGTVFGAPAVAS